MAREVATGHSRRRVPRAAAGAALGALGLARAGGVAADALCKPAIGSQSRSTKDARCYDGLVCEAGRCQSGCQIGAGFYADGATNPANACQSCQPSTSTTGWSTKTNGVACTAADKCFRTYSCQAGTCTGSDRVNCTAIDQGHDAGTCQPSSGACTNPAKADGRAFVTGTVRNGRAAIRASFDTWATIERDVAILEEAVMAIGRC
jgi:hypothetical protein